MRRTKIVCTLGPASSSAATLRAMIRAGMDVARVNFSHGTRAEHGKVVEAVRVAAGAEGKPVAVMQDIQGPKVRVGALPQPLLLQPGQVVRLAGAGKARGDVVPVTHEGLARDAQPGLSVLLDDGLLELRVQEVQGDEVVCEVVTGGVLKPGKSLNLPGARLSLESLSLKDVEDIRFGLKLDVDYLAASFIRGPEDLAPVRALVMREELPVKVLAKVERAEALVNLDAILAACDGALVARGDLGVELPPEEVPVIQKRLIARCNTAGLPVVTATQMLESMVTNPRPTRAEASDVANAVLDGTSAVMLSGETAVGKDPVRVVQVMDRIVRRAEAADTAPFRHRIEAAEQPAIGDAIAHAAVTTAEQLGARAIVALTNSGGTARLVSKYHPSIPILGVSPIERTVGQLALLWGVEPLKVPRAADEEALLRTCFEAAKAKGLLAAGDKVVVTGGQPGVTGTTDRLQVRTVP